MKKHIFIFDTSQLNNKDQIKMATIMVGNNKIEMKIYNLKERIKYRISKLFKHE